MGAENAGLLQERGIIGILLDCSSRKLLLERVFRVRSDAYHYSPNYYAI
jgi:hypothetical protein